MTASAYIYATGAVTDAAPQAAPRRADALPVVLRDRMKSHNLSMPRLSSRFAQLAVLGAQQCLSRLPAPLPNNTRVYLGTGLGDIARTDALYYEVMPPSSQIASPAQFATSGNNMAAFFVAQQAAFRSRNLTVSLEALSFEQALLVALADLSAGACATALVGGVDETTVPREFYVRRFALAQNHPIGEGSAWWALGSAPEHAIGQILHACVLPPSSENDDQWTGTIARLIAQIVAPLALANGRSARAPLVVLPGCRIRTSACIALAHALPEWQIRDYLQFSGYYPTAAAGALCDALREVRGHVRSEPDRADSILVHVNRDDAGRTGLIAIRAYDE